MKKTLQWTIVPDRPWFSFNLTALISYRHLIYSMTCRDITAMYQQTVLGPVWVIINPLITTAVFTIVFGNLSGFANDGLPKPLFYLSGIIIWTFFSECLNRISSVFKDNQTLFGKVYFPRLIVPVSIALSMLFRLAIHLSLFGLALAFFYLKGAHFKITSAVLLLPGVFLLTAFQALGVGITMAALTAKYRDLTLLLSFIVQLFMYATPVIYPLSAAPPAIRWLISANPLTPLIETFRFALLGNGTYTCQALLQSAVSSFLLLFLGLIAFHRTEKNFIDTI